MSEFKIDKLFHDKLVSYEARPSDKAWDAINERIQKSGKKNFNWIYAIAASLVLVLTSAAIWINSSKDIDTILADNGVTQVDTDIIVAAEEGSEENNIIRG